MANVKVTFNKGALRKLEKEIQKKFEVAASKHPFKKGESLAEIEKTLADLVKSIGGSINADGLKRKAKEIFDKLNK